MSDIHNRIKQLDAKLSLLLSKQEEFSKEIEALRREIFILKNTTEEFTIQETENSKQVVTQSSPAEEFIIENDTNINLEKPTEEKDIIEEILQTTERPIKNSKKSNLEKFIGENLINKIGIFILIIGVAIGAKYSIENNLISPLTRIILGYLAGLGLLAFGIKLKAKYESYSAVLVSGSITILYFITFFAYSLYGLFPQWMSFILMVIFTLFTVIAALNYNQQIIALLGLVGAYAIPFLLSNESGNPLILFSYMAILNCGMLFLAFKKYWKIVYYTAFTITWSIYMIWLISNYNLDNDFGLAFTFAFLFFIIFYATFLAYKLIKKDFFIFTDILLLIINSFLFFGIGYYLLENSISKDYSLGLFTLFNALIHFIVGVFIYRLKLVDKNLFYLVIGLVIVFITIAFPIQLDGQWVTLFWLGLAILLFWIGKTQKISFYEYFSYAIMLLAFLSLNHDWNQHYGTTYFSNEPEFTPIFNTNFLASFLFIAGFAFIQYIHRKNESISQQNKTINKISIYLIPGILIYVVYFSFFLEIAMYFMKLYQESKVSITQDDIGVIDYYNYDINSFQAIWLLNYTLFFASILSFINLKKVKRLTWSYSSSFLTLLTLILFLFLGFSELNNLRNSYILQEQSTYYNIGISNIVIRYLCFALIGLNLYLLNKNRKIFSQSKYYKIIFEIFLFTYLLVIISNELIHWLDLFNNKESYGLGLSILWAIYSLVLVVLGIKQKKKYLRLFAMILFGITLIKLFIYDLSNLNTISKTIVLVSLGILLLIISYLYNKYKNIISDENKD